MKEDKPFSIVDRAGSFRHALRGLFDIIRTEHNAWVHAVFTVLILLLSWWLEVSFIQFALLVLAIVSVWVAEAFNTVVEILVDIVSPSFSESAKRAKDIGAAAVLIAAIGAIILGSVILGPLLYEKLKGFYFS